MNNMHGFIKFIVKNSLAEFSESQINLKSDQALETLSNSIADSIICNELILRDFLVTKSGFLDK